MFKIFNTVTNNSYKNVFNVAFNIRLKIKFNVLNVQFIMLTMYA